MADKTGQFGTDSVASLMTRYSLPSIVAMLAMTGFNLINMAFVGRSIGPLGIAAIAICSPVTMIQGSISQFISNGCAAAVSIELGKGNREGARGILGCSLLLNTIIASVNMVLGFAFITPLLQAFGASAAILPYAHDYLFIYLCGISLSTLTTMNPMIRIEGYPKQAMFTMLVMTSVNISLTPLFIFVFHMGIKGAAFGSLCAQIVMACWVFVFLIRKNRAVRLEWKNLRLRVRTILLVMQLGLPTFLMQSTQSLLSVVMNRSLGTYGGDIAISAWGITNNINSVVAQPIFGLNQGAQPIIGYNYGAKNYRRVKQSLVYTLVAATVFSFLSWLVIRVFPEAILAFFTDEPELIAIGSRMLLIFRALIFIVGFQQAGAAYFQYSGKPRTSIFLTLTRQVLFLIPCVMILPRYFRLDGILYSGPISDLLATLITGVYIIFELKRLDKLEKEKMQQNEAGED